MKEHITQEYSVAIQGYEGSFHQLAAWQLFGKNITLQPCATFSNLIQLATQKKVNAAVMAIENSIAGSILPNYTLLQKSNLVITAEVYLPIKQHLLVNRGVALQDIKEVHSHPMAIQQCMEYLSKFSWKLVDTEDTALSAKHIHQHKAKHIAAIAGKQAAEMFNLDIAAANIHTQKNNYTRFLLLEREADANEIKNANKASIHFTTAHTQGSLAKVLSIIAAENINLSKLQSMPIAGTRFLYSFHADLEFVNVTQLHTALKNIKTLITDYKILGIYNNGNINY